MDATKITEYLAVGAYTAIPEMQRDGWKCVCFAQTVPVPDTCKHIPLLDGGGNDPKKIEEGLRWIADAWKNGDKVYCCCRHGMNRSVLMAAGALAVTGKAYGVIQAWQKISSKRITGSRDDTLYDVLGVVLALRGDGPGLHNFG